MMFERCDRNPLVVHRGRHTIPTLLILACALVATAPARSQEAPAGRPTVTIVHPFAPGGVGYDLGHVIGDRFRRLFNIPVIVEAKPGVNTVLGVTSVVKSRPDGQTLLINSASITAIAGMIYKAQPYNPATDLVPVAFVAQVPLVLVVSAELPVKSLDGLVQLARKTPKGLSYASTGVGSAQHISLEFLKRELRIDMTHVPFRGPIPALTAVAGGHTELMLIDVLNAASLIEAGKVQADRADDGGASRCVSRCPDLCRGRFAGLRSRSSFFDLCGRRHAVRDRCPAELEYSHRDRRPGRPRAIW